MEASPLLHRLLTIFAKKNFRDPRYAAISADILGKKEVMVRAAIMTGYVVLAKYPHIAPTSVLAALGMPHANRDLTGLREMMNVISDSIEIAVDHLALKLNGMVRFNSFIDGEKMRAIGEMPGVTRAEPAEGRPESDIVDLSELDDSEVVDIDSSGKVTKVSPERIETVEKLDITDATKKDRMFKSSHGEMTAEEHGHAADTSDAVGDDMKMPGRSHETVVNHKGRYPDPRIPRGKIDAMDAVEASSLVTNTRSKITDRDLQRIFDRNVSNARKIVKDFEPQIIKVIGPTTFESMYEILLSLAEETAARVAQNWIDTVDAKDVSALPFDELAAVEKKLMISTGQAFVPVVTEIVDQHLRSLRPMNMVDPEDYKARETGNPITEEFTKMVSPTAVFSAVRVSVDAKSSPATLDKESEVLKMKSREIYERERRLAEIEELESID